MKLNTILEDMFNDKEPEIFRMYKLEETVHNYPLYLCIDKDTEIIDNEKDVLISIFPEININGKQYQLDFSVMGGFDISDTTFFHFSGKKTGENIEILEEIPNNFKNKESFKKIADDLDEKVVSEIMDKVDDLEDRLER